MRLKSSNFHNYYIYIPGSSASTYINMLSDCASFHSMYIEETLNKSDSLYSFIGGNSGIGTWNYTKAILIHMDFILGRT